MNNRLSKIPAFSLLLALVPLAANAVPTTGTPVLGPNGHYYEFVAASQITWDAANSAANNLTFAGIAGHLATITSAAEDDFIEVERQETSLGEMWVGGFQDPITTPDAKLNWTWLNGEGSFPGDNSGPGYANWNFENNEPNDNYGAGSEQHLTVGLGDSRKWNDEGVTPATGLGNMTGYVIEYDLRTNADDDSAEAKSGETISIDVLANDDVDIGVQSIVIVSDPEFGGTADVIGVGEDSVIEYKSGAGFGGMDTFVYQVTAINGLTDTATVTVDVSTTVSVVVPGLNPLFFNQANVPGSNNPLTAAFQEVLVQEVPVSGEVSVRCCRILDDREGAGPAKHGFYLRRNLDLGMAIADVGLNESCKGMPTVHPGTALLAPWQRGVPTSRGLPSDTTIARQNDLGVCVIQSDIVSKGVVFSEEDARNVLGYQIDCAEPNISFRPFTGGVAIDPTEIDAPFVTSWTAECDESRSAKKYSNNLMVLNLRHDRAILSSKLYVSGKATLTFASILGVKLEGCVDNSTGFLNKLLDLTARANVDILKGKGEAAVVKLDAATKLALLIGPGVPFPDPYREGLAACPDNPKGLIVGRLMALKFAACSEIVQAGAGEISESSVACAIDLDILAALPPLPTL